MTPRILSLAIATAVLTAGCSSPVSDLARNKAEANQTIEHKRLEGREVATPLPAVTPAPAGEESVAVRADVDAATASLERAKEVRRRFADQEGVVAQVGGPAEAAFEAGNVAATSPPPKAGTHDAPGRVAPGSITLGKVARADAAQAQIASARIAPTQLASGTGAPAPARQPAATDALAALRAAAGPVDREKYGEVQDNPVHRVTEVPVSTFSIDVDTGGYANVRSMLRSGNLPPTDAVRAEEMINYFTYDYPAPATRDVPFSLHTDLVANPWNAQTRLLRVGIQGYNLAADELPPSNLVFLVDVSGSMRSADKIGLLRTGLTRLAERMRPEDRVAIVVYAGASGVVLDSTSGDRREQIINALSSLRAGGSTNGAAGIRLAYQVARDNFIKGGINRILLATDGDFNVGTTNFDTLKDLVSRERDSGVSLTTLGFGRGNYNEQLMEQLADAGDGNYAYIDSEREAGKVLVDEMAGTLATIARDVKIQIEFNPATVSEYRLIGYANRRLAREDFDNDKVDAGEIGAGHSVTALYEVALRGEAGERLRPLRYGTAPATDTRDISAEIAHLRVRYKLPEGDASRLVERAITPDDVRETADQDLRFATAVAGFAQALRGGRYLQDFSYANIAALAGSATGEDPRGLRREFLSLVEQARRLAPADSAGVAVITPGRG